MPRIAILAAITIISLAVGGFGIYQYQKAQSELKNLKDNPQAQAQEEVKKLVEQVGKLIDLPKGEDPTVATITDASKLKDQAFFKNAQNGDRVLIYSKAKKAILYRPSTNKVIEIAPVNLGQTEKATAALYNGTTTAGLTKTIEERLEGKFTNVDVTVRENASKNNYDDTIVVDVSGRNATLAKQIADELGGRVGSLPSGETKPQTDLLVILGAQ
jgi:hypothetical protein